MKHTTIVLGAGHAGVNFAIALRKNGYEGDIQLMDAQPGLPYQRPPLSKNYLLGLHQEERLTFRPAQFFHTQNIELVQARLERICPDTRTVWSQQGRWRYDTLVLALGSYPRQVAVQSRGYENVFSIASLEQARTLKQHMVPGHRAVVLGAGFIGLEFARAARSADMQVSVVDVASQVMGRSLPKDMADYVQARHEQAGVEFFFEDSLLEAVGDGGRVRELVFASGRRLSVDVLVLGIGSHACDRLAAQAGLETQDGIVVNDYLQTAMPSIFAIGDCARIRSENGGTWRLESVQNAHDQARYLAARLMEKNAEPYRALPWFWSDQGDLKIQIAGGAGPYEQVKTFVDDQKQGAVSYCFSVAGLSAVATVNCPRLHMVARERLARPEGWSLRYDELQSDSFDAFLRIGSETGAGC